MRLSNSICAAITLTISLCGAISYTQADIIREGSDTTLRYGYGPTAGGLDANTTHLWRFDEPTGTLADSTTVTATAIPLQFAATTAEQPSVLFSPGGAGNSARRIDINTGSGANQNIMRAFADINEASSANSADNLSAEQYNSFFGADGSFTLDFLIRPDFNPGSTPSVSAGMRIFSQEGGHSTEPNFFSLTWLGTNQLQLAVVPAGIDFNIPLSGDNAFTASGQWFHVGISYNGDAGATDNTNFYWTLVDGPATALALATEEANLAGSYTLANDPPTVETGQTAPEWNFGNRPSGNRSFVGAFDEFRISNVARDESDFIFADLVQPGDHNLDDAVNAIDYVIWREDPPAHGDDAGYEAWRANFGIGDAESGGLTSGSIPEPSALFLVAASLVIGPLCIGRKCRK
jgi:hypothetical protein